MFNRLEHVIITGELFEMFKIQYLLKSVSLTICRKKWKGLGVDSF